MSVPPGAPRQTAAAGRDAEALVTIVGISGSLRAGSSNTQVLHAMSSLAPAHVAVTVFAGLASLPWFSPDLDAEGAASPPAVDDFRRQLRDADALLICSPEYAHGVPGVLKNALDWLVSVPDLVGKPVGILNISPWATHAQASLVETLRTMSLTVVPAASITVPLVVRPVDGAAVARDPGLAAAFRGVIGALALAARESRARLNAPAAEVR